MCQEQPDLQNNVDDKKAPGEDVSEGRGQSGQLDEVLHQAASLRILHISLDSILNHANGFILDSLN